MSRSALATIPDGCGQEGLAPGAGDPAVQRPHLHILTQAPLCDLSDDLSSDTPLYIPLYQGAEAPGPVLTFPLWSQWQHITVAL